MVQRFLDHIRTLLHSQEVEVSYFAAGILAHLTSRGEKAWTLSPQLRSSLLEQLVGIIAKCLNVSDMSALCPRWWSEWRDCFFPQHDVIMKWPPPECEMVAYRWVTASTKKVHLKCVFRLVVFWKITFRTNSIWHVSSSHSLDHSIPSFLYWSASTPPASSCGRLGPCSMSAARTVRPKTHIHLNISNRHLDPQTLYRCNIESSPLVCSHSLLQHAVGGGRPGAAGACSHTPTDARWRQVFGQKHPGEFAQPQSSHGPACLRTDESQCTAAVTVQRYTHTHTVVRYQIMFSHFCIFFLYRETLWLGGSTTEAFFYAYVFHSQIHFICLSVLGRNMNINLCTHTYL